MAARRRRVSREFLCARVGSRASTDAVLPRVHRSVGPGSGSSNVWPFKEPDGGFYLTLRCESYNLKHGVGVVSLSVGSTAPNPPLRLKHRSVELTIYHVSWGGHVEVGEHLRSLQIRSTLRCCRRMARAEGWVPSPGVSFSRRLRSLGAEPAEALVRLLPRRVRVLLPLRLHLPAAEEQQAAVPRVDIPH